MTVPSAITLWCFLPAVMQINVMVSWKLGVREKSLWNYYICDMRCWETHGKHTANSCGHYIKMCQVETITLVLLDTISHRRVFLKIVGYLNYLDYIATKHQLKDTLQMLMASDPLIISLFIFACCNTINCSDAFYKLLCKLMLW